jgi:regulator of sigma E protease
MLLDVLITIVVFAFTISLLVFIHEGGHFLVAKWARVWVHEFAIGFGPAILRRRWGETLYTLRLLPLGGFVRLAGEDRGSEEDRQVPPERLFTSKPPLVRMAVILAGPLMNIAAAVVLMILYVGIFGTPFVEIAEVAAESPAWGKLQSGDKLVRLAGEEIYFPEQIQTIVQHSQGRPLEALIDRGGSRSTLTLTPYWDETRGQYLIGVYFVYPLNRIAHLPSDSSLAAQGLKEGDVILAVNDKPIGSWPEFARELTRLLQAKEPISLKLLRDESPIDLRLEPSIDPGELGEVRPYSFAPLPPTYPLIRSLEPDSFLAKAGLRPGDRLIMADGEEINSLTNLVKALLRARGVDGRLELTLERAGEQKMVELDVSTLELGEVLKGVQLQIAQRRPQGIGASISLGLKRIRDTLVLLYLGIRQVITGQIGAGEAFRGPVGIANLLGWSLTQGFDYFFRLVALLSLVLGVFNLIPFPALDGSRIVFVLFELIFRKPIPPEKEGWVHYIGFLILMGLIVLITWQDIQRLFRGEL